MTATHSIHGDPRGNSAGYVTVTGYAVYVFEDRYHEQSGKQYLHAAYLIIAAELGSNGEPGHLFYLAADARVRRVADLIAEHGADLVRLGPVA